MPLKKTCKWVLWYLFMAVIVVIVLFPLAWMIASSFKTQQQIITTPPVWFFKPVVANYTNVIFENDFLKYTLNSVIVAAVSTIVSLLIGLPAAYSISRFQQNKLLLTILVARLMPGISFLLPWFIIFKKMGLIDTYVGLIASHMVIALPLIVCIMANYFDGIPKELEEAAAVDGCTKPSAFLRVVIPLSGPGVMTAITLTIIFSWNNFMFSFILSSERTKTLPIAIYNFVSYAEINWGAVMAAATIIIAPAMVMTMFFQKYVVKGLTAGAVKG